MFALTPLGRIAPRATSREITDFYDIVDDFFNDISPLNLLRGNSFKIDVKGNEKEYLIDAELPGFKKEEIALDFENGNLMISASRSEEKNDDKENYLHRERRVSSMQRSVHLPNAKEEGITAKFENGILTVTAPKADSTPNKPRIEIQ
jgi:HSP20 family protein